MRLILILFTLLLGYGLPSRALSSFAFKKFQVKDGLSHNTVWCGMQDSYGFIWLGTSDGLNCYYGVGNQVYRNSLSNPHSLENNFVESLLEVDGNIWVGTNGGIYIYDRSTNRFSFFDQTTQYGVTISSEVKRIVRTRNGLLWIATFGQGLFVYNAATRELKQDSQQTSFVNDICQSARGSEVYVSSLIDGLFRYDEFGSFISRQAISDGFNAADNQHISCLNIISGELWMGAGVNQLCRLNEITGEVDRFAATNYNFGSVRCIFDYGRHRLLVGTDDGLYLFNRHDNTFVRIDNPDGERSLSDPTVNAMMRDAEGTLWVMTNLGGLNYMPQETKRFDYYSPAKSRWNLGVAGVVSAFALTPNGDVWVGTHAGLYHFAPAMGILTPRKVGAIANEDADVRSLYLDGDCLWVGLQGQGLRVIDLRTGFARTYQHSRHVPNTLCGNDVNCIYKDSKGDIYVGTDRGLSRYDAENDNFQTMTSVGYMVAVVDMLEDRNHNIWIATDNSGVFTFNNQNEHWQHFQHQRSDSTTITGNSVISLFEDREGHIWLGTNGGGLCRYNEDTQTFSELDPQGFLLPNKVIYAVEQDDNGDFWISSNAGIFKINPYTKRELRQFTITDGLQGNQFMPRASLHTPAGSIYFGGLKGFNVFRPENIVDNAYIPPIYIMRLQLSYYGDEESGGSSRGYYSPLYRSKEVVLPYEDNSFSLRFVALSYVDAAKNNFMYRLRGVDRDWVMSGQNNTATYTNLPPGEYEFEVRGSNNDRQWNDNPARLRIVITPPWWLTGWAYAGYALLFLGVLAWFAWLWNVRVKRKYRRRMDSFLVTQEKEAYQTKINFFVNLVHEIRTPLTLIRLPLDKMLETARQGADAEYLHVIDKNVNYLLGVTNELLDFQKMESGALQLVLQNTDVKAMVSDVYEQFTAPAHIKGLRFDLQLPDEDVISAIDADKVRKILVNLMGNAVKYARNRIELRLTCKAKNFNIEVRDDGRGVPDDQKQKIFEPFYQVTGDRVAASTGTGMGLAFARFLAEAHYGNLRLLDTPGGGSTFQLTLPLAKVKKVAAPEPQTDVVENEDIQSPPAVSLAERKYAVLVVEDNKDLLNLTSDALGQWFRVFKAADGGQALEVLQAEDIDVIVSDVMMPVMNGLELCRRVKSDVNYSHIPVILLTAKTTVEAKVEGFECGADAYVEKPFAMKQLYLQIMNLLKMRQTFYQTMAQLTDMNSVAEQTDTGMTRCDREFLAKMQEIVNCHMSDENFSVEELTASLNISRSSFYRKVKALCDMSPNDYLKYLRMQRAARLIERGETISNVARQVGFTSASYFAKCFKLQHGMVPKDYAESVGKPQNEVAEAGQGDAEAEQSGGAEDAG